MHTLDWHIRAYLKEFNEESASLPLLITLMLHADLGGLCYPSTEFLADELGTTQRRIIDARKWLLSHGVYLPVPYTLRGEKLKGLPRRQFIYQLTGLYLSKNGSVIPYLYMTPEGREDTRARLMPLIEVLKTVKTEVSDLEVYDLIAKGISISKGSSTKKSAGKKPAMSPKPKKEKERNPYFDVIVKLFGYDEKGVNSNAGIIRRVAKELKEAGYTPEQIPVIYAYCQSQTHWTGFTPKALSSHAGNAFRANKTNGNATSALNGIRILNGGGK